LVSLRSRDSIVLNIDNRSGQVSERRQQPRHVSGMLADRRLVENVQHVLKPASEGNGQPYPLRLPA
jgi:hypothetical protein